MSTKPLDEKIRDAAEEFRDPEIEYQLVAYLSRSNPVAAGMMQKAWLSDILLQDVFSVVNDLRITMSKPMLINEMNERGLIGKDEDQLYDEVVDQLFTVDVSLFNSKNVKHMMLQVLKLHETRGILTGCGEIIGGMKNFNLDDAKRKLMVLGRPVDLVDTENSGMYLDDYETRIEVMAQKKEDSENHEGNAGIPTGIYRFDHLIGGMMKKEFGLIAGITGVGKTASLVNFGVHAWVRGHDVMLVSGEMSKEALEFRIDSYLTEISGLKFRVANLEDEDFKKWDDTIKMYRAKQHNMLYVGAYTRRFTAESIERDLMRIQEETGRKVEVICADYINIMDPVRRAGKGGWEDQAEAVWDFKGLVAEHDLVGWTAGQVKDEAYEKELFDAQDLKYARAISECAPVIAALIRSEKDIIENRMKLQILKMRNAPLPSRPIVLTPKLDIMRIHQDVYETKTLSGRLPDTLDIKKTSQRSARPKKTLHEH